MLLAAPHLAAEPLTPEDIYERTISSVVTLKIVNTAGERYTGSAFLALTDGIAVTAWHVIHDAQQVTALFSDGTTVPVTGLVDRAPGFDLALIKLDSKGRTLLRISSRPPRIGARAYVIGAPKGYGFSIADGLLSQVRTIEGVQHYQMSCPLSTGNSGGPVINDAGEVIAIASWSKAEAQNVNFALPISHLQRLNPAAPPVPWVQVRRSTGLTEAPSSSRMRSPKTQNGGDLDEFRQLLKSSAGQPITVVVPVGTDTRRFSFVVPE